MEEEAIEQFVVVQTPIMPRRPDRRVCIELEDRICSLFAKEDVSSAHFIEIREDLHLFDI